MLMLSRALHLLALGLWFGSVAFFSLTGLLLFQSFEQLSDQPAESRPLWFPRPPEFEGDWKGESLSGPRSKEQGSRAAGFAVSPIFPWYYGIQSACALVAVCTALGWALQRGGTWNKWRAGVLVVALLTLVVGWWLEQRVSALRSPRNENMDAALRSADPTPQVLAAAKEARARFGMWHGFSLLQNFATLFLVTAAMIMAAQLPTTVTAAASVPTATSPRQAVASLARPAPADVPSQTV